MVYDGSRLNIAQVLADEGCPCVSQERIWEGAPICGDVMHLQRSTEIGEKCWKFYASLSNFISTLF